MGADGSLNFDTKIDSSGFNSGISKLGSIAKGGLAVVGAAVAGGVAAFAGLTKASLDATASLEQNVGGIETLFGAGGKTLEEYAASVGKSTAEAKKDYEQLMNAQNIALDNANKAYKTAGLSANEYMETVTSFAASLKQSVANETEAAEAANMAVIDMADNANKMGSSMESIQNAYQGFAKQNYTMLDNLKLGYGGTKTEMQRLLKDAQKLTGIKYDINNLADVYSAIHVIQEELGITGTTADEAAKTLAGSMSAAQSAWENLLAGVGTSEEFADAFGTAAANIISNIIDIVPRIAATIPDVISQIGENLSTQLETSYLGEIGLSLIDQIGQGIVDNAPRLLEKGFEITTNLLTGITDSAPAILESGSILIDGLLTSFENKSGALISSGVDLILSLASGILSQAPTLAARAISLVSTLANSILSESPQILQTGFRLVGELVSGILQQLPSIIGSAGSIIMSFYEHIIGNLPEIVDSGAEMLLSLVEGIIEQLPEIISSAVTVVSQLATSILSEGLPKLLEAGFSLIGKLAAGIIQGVPSLISQLPGIISNIKSQFTSINWGQVGRDILSGIARGISNGVGSIISAARSAAQSALNAAKNFLGIRSPSRKFRDEVGAMMAEGMGIGFEDNIPVDDMQKSINNSVDKLKTAAHSITTNPPLTTGMAIQSSNVVSGSTVDNDSNKTIIIHTHVDLDGEEVGNSTTKYIDRNLSDIEELKDRGC